MKSNDGVHNRRGTGAGAEATITDRSFQGEKKCLAIRNGPKVNA